MHKPSNINVFLASLIDYAGLFPPAKLDLDQAINNFVEYRRGADAWMLGRFIIPVSRLPELKEHSDLFDEADSAPFSVLGHPALEQTILSAARQTFLDAREFEEQHHGTVVADRFEFKLQPHHLDRHVMVDLFGEVDEALRNNLARPAKAYYEVALMGERWEHELEIAAELLSDHKARVGDDTLGLKFRCGGVTKDAFPTTGAVARAIHTAYQANVSFKGTAGLHHPVRHFADSVNTKMHGFLNVFGGAVLTKVHNLNRATLEQIIEDEDVDHFTLNSEGFSWKDLSATSAEIESARADFATSFGSCSFDEPRDDLRQLDILEPASEIA